MPWERRERGGLYYTRSKKVNGKVVREYVGGGVLGEIAARMDALERRQREEEAGRWKEKRKCLEQKAAFLLELEEATKILTTAHLIAAGCHKHHGEWRRLRESI
jgi:hypothetical protein